MPRLIKFSGAAQDETHKLLTGVVGVTFSLYKDRQGGSPLWVETQNAQADAAGHYTALLGSATADGAPLSLFSSAMAHWISTQISGQRESAADATCAGLMGLEPDRVIHIHEVAKFPGNSFPRLIDQVGETFQRLDVPFSSGPGVRVFEAKECLKQKRYELTVTSGMLSVFA